LRAMAILTRMVAIREFPTVGTLGEMPAECLGAARCNGCHRREMAGEHTVVELRPVRRAITAENFSQLNHGRPPARLRGHPSGLPGCHVPWRRPWQSGAWRGPWW